MEEYKYYAIVNSKLYEEKGSGWFSEGDTVITSDGTVGKVTKKVFISDEIITAIKLLGNEIHGKVVGEVRFFDEAES